MHHLLAEQRVTLTELAQQQQVSSSTVWRWTMRGLRGVRLETYSIGGRRFTTREAFDRFILGSQHPSNSGSICASSVPLPREHRDADAYLATEGI
jgi:hypothetical protein